jgi:dTDP-4-amino-4,6-dideoxygalactose transaminase
MDIPLLDLKAQYQQIRPEIEKVVGSVMESQYFILSEEVNAFEQEVAEYTGVPFAAGVASGTDAILISLKAAGIGEGDRVATSAFTFFATSEAISLLGAEPVFVDIEPETYNIDPEKLEKALSIRGDIKAVIPVHLYGQCADMRSITQICREKGTDIIEDCCQAIGALHNGNKAGSFGLAGCYSFFPSKNLGGFGDGGMIVTRNTELAEKAKRLRVHGSREQYVHEEIGYNSRLDSLQAAVLRIKLRKLDEWLASRRDIASRYNDAFGELPVETPQVLNGNIHTYHQYTLRTGKRDELQDHLRSKGISSRVYYPVPLHLQPCYRHLGYNIGSLPETERACEEVISIPVYPELGDEKVDYIIKAVKEFYAN